MSDATVDGPIREDAMTLTKTGRVTINRRIRDVLGVGPGDVVQVTVLLDDETETFTDKIDGNNRILVPLNIRHKHMLDEGDEQIDLKIERIA